MPVTSRPFCKEAAMHEQLKPPSFFRPALTDDRLRTLVDALLEVRFSTLREMNSPLDDNYTREATIFGRQRNQLINMALQPELAWLTLAHAGMDVTVCIDNVPLRFFTEDNPENPRKDGFFRRNVVDNLFPTDEAEPVMWRIVIERNPADPTGDRGFVIGYSAVQEAVSAWECRSSRPPLHSVDGDVPRAVPLPPPPVEALEQDVAAKDHPDAGARGA
jgi:hypothetical protein